MSRLSNAAVVALALAGGAVVAGAPARADTVVFHATLSTADEVPPKTGAGRGSATATLDTTSRVVDYQVMYSDLSGAATMAHFHGPAAPGANAGVEVPLGTNAASPIKGSATLTEFADGRPRGRQDVCERAYAGQSRRRDPRPARPRALTLRALAIVPLPSPGFAARMLAVRGAA